MYLCKSLTSLNYKTMNARKSSTKKKYYTHLIGVIYRMRLTWTREKLVKKNMYAKMIAILLLYIWVVIFRKELIIVPWIAAQIHTQIYKLFVNSKVNAFHLVTSINRLVKCTSIASTQFLMKKLLHFQFIWNEPQYGRFRINSNPHHFSAFKINFFQITRTTTTMTMLMKESECASNAIQHSLPPPMLAEWMS